ncbi:hypothetical protein CHF27_011070 [Romboutsia maritimum]|uniref:Uncharacterized protein n=1 Tax=Romboutsia maritimum TaxID=2020948 RepID=A0A371IQW0_9FIRM|nr:hypothetical protein [Romboutsia maritimum]RDY22854.1 hypothetical protein CHF27_011070 [Romboutsia maritimum]
MLNKNKLDVASKMATQLLKEGMLWGEELENFIKSGKGRYGYTFYTTEEEYLEFENAVLDYIEKRINKQVKVTDIKTKTSAIYKGISEATKGIRCNSPGSLYYYIKYKKIYKNRYLIEHSRPKLNEI